MSDRPEGGTALAGSATGAKDAGGAAAATLDDVKRLREETAAGMLDCKKALTDAGGDFEKARDILRKKGLAAAAKRADRVASQGLIASYVHMGKVGVLVDVRCETDFVARTEEFGRMAKAVAMQVAVARPRFLKREEVPADVIEREKAIFTEQAAASGKPPQIVEKMVAGKLEKFYAEVCLLEQEFLIAPESSAKTVSDFITEIAAKVGEKVELARYSRLELGA
ncbi:MAG: translation elongation factor Ts [Candidatus Hydrogenedentota bacterium]